MIQGLLPFKYENDKQKSNIKGFGGLPIKIAGDEILLGGDIILTANNQALNSEDRYRKFVQKIKIGDKVRLIYYGKVRQVRWNLLSLKDPFCPGIYLPKKLEPYRA